MPFDTTSYGEYVIILFDFSVIDVSREDIAPVDQLFHMIFEEPISDSDRDKITEIIREQMESQYVLPAARNRSSGPSQVTLFSTESIDDTG